MDNEERRRKCEKERLCCCKDGNNGGDNPKPPKNLLDGKNENKIEIDSMDNLRFYVSDPAIAQEVKSFLEEKHEDIVSVAFITRDAGRKIINLKENSFTILCLDNRKPEYRTDVSLTQPPKVVKVIVKSIHKKERSTQSVEKEKRKVITIKNGQTD